MVQKAPVCQGCIKWDSFKGGCWVHWENKKICSMRVETKDEWDDEKRNLI